MKLVEFNEPFQKFSIWLDEACAKKEIIEPTAMCLASVGENGAPSARMILLKTFDERGFCFFTNFTSRKAQQLAKNSHAALCFYWGILGRQIRIEGVVEEVSKIEADDYFASRRRGSQIGAWASKQSQEMQNWQEFLDRISAEEKKFAGKEVARPHFWSGFRLVPKNIEFWQEGEFRLHRRDLFERAADGWNVKIIYP